MAADQEEDYVIYVTRGKDLPKRSGEKKLHPTFKVSFSFE